MATEEKKERSPKEPDWSPITQMTFKNIGCTPKEAIKQDKTLFMARVYGEASEVKQKEARNGDIYVYLIGEFRAINAAGKQFESSKLFLPNSIFEEVQAALKANDGKPIQFGYDIHAGPSDNTIGYAYAAKKIIRTAANDRLAQMAKEVDAKPMPKG